MSTTGAQIAYTAEPSKVYTRSKKGAVHRWVFHDAMMQLGTIINVPPDKRNIPIKHHKWTWCWFVPDHRIVFLVPVLASYPCQSGNAINTTHSTNRDMHRSVWCVFCLLRSDTVAIAVHNHVIQNINCLWANTNNHCQMDSYTIRGGSILQESSQRGYYQAVASPVLPHALKHDLQVIFSCSYFVPVLVFCVFHYEQVACHWNSSLRVWFP